MSVLVMAISKPFRPWFSCWHARKSSMY
eukprot:COSAG02_NODE_62138_length_266_cov_1.502994_1_plen_27_part_01